MAQVLQDARMRDTPPFRYDVVGSFLRPQNLKDARAQYAAGKLSQAELTAVEDREIEKLVAKEKEAGLKALTDGEFRRGWWNLDFFWGFDGIEKARSSRGYQFHDEETRAETALLSGKIRFSHHPFLDHYAFLKKIAGEDVTAKQTIPAPAQLLGELLRPEGAAGIEKFYPDREALYHDIAEAYHGAILGFYQRGCRNIQLDDCTWGMLCDKAFRTALEGSPMDAGKLGELYLRLNNEAIRDLPPDLVLTTHVCRGNYHSTWASSGGYEPVAETLFAREQVSAFFLEFDTERAGDFSPLRHVPRDKQVVLGIFSSKTGALEDRDLIMKRIEEAARYVPIERICLSPQCGFASTEEGNILTEAQQWAKLALIQKIAREIWR
jgi:methionine synthase II (cobalamin-independent)